MEYKLWLLVVALFLVSLFFDKTILYFFQDIRISWLNDLIVTFSEYTNWAALFGLIAIIILIWRRKYIYRFIIGSGLFLILIWVIRIILKRPRPFLTLDIISLIPDKTGYSFPSGHASFAFFSLPFIWKLFPRFKWIWLLIVILISLSRVYVGVHYFSDIIGGALLGLFLGSLFVKNKVFGDLD